MPEPTKPGDPLWCEPLEPKPPGVPGKPTFLEDGARLNAMLDEIRQGVWHYVAAQSVGVHHDTFNRWMREGKKNPESKYNRFYVAVQAAVAIARKKCEREVHDAKPLDWLRFGPGRDKPGEPGWGETKATDVESIAQQEFESEVLKAIEEVDPAAKARIVEALRSTRATRGVNSEDSDDEHQSQAGSP